MKSYILGLLLTSLISSAINVAAGSDNFKRPLPSKTVFMLSSGKAEDYTQKIIVISSRHFNSETNSISMRGVHPKRELFYFVVTKKQDTARITRHPDLNSAMEAFHDESEFLYFVHGHGKSFEQVVDRGFEVGSRYGTNMIMFDWPSDYYAIKKSIRNTRKVTESFVQVSDELNQIFSEYKTETKTSVVFHSMGNRIIKRAVKKEMLSTLPENLFENVVLNAAAVKQKGHAKWVSQLSVQKQIYIVSNEGDLPLKGVKFLRFATQLGSEYQTPLAKNATYINFSEIATREHNIFLGLTQVEKEHPGIFDFYNQVFHHQQVDVFNSNNFAESSLPELFFIL